MNEDAFRSNNRKENVLLLGHQFMIDVTSSALLQQAGGNKVPRVRFLHQVKIYYCGD